MKANKKGFTLIELLAVIVILSIIALIATPIVMNVIQKSKKGAAEDTVYGLIKAAEFVYAQSLIEDEIVPDTDGSFVFDCSKTGSGGKKCVTAKGVELSYNGTQPDSGTITVDASGDVSLSALTVNQLACDYKLDSNNNKTSKIECTSKK